MRVSTRIILGFATLMILLVCALAYQVSIIHEMQSINQDLSSTNFNAASSVLRLRQYGDSIDELSQKYFVSPVSYEPQLESYHKQFLDELTTLRGTVRTDSERIEVERLSQRLDEYYRVWEEEKSKPLPEDVNSFPFTLAQAIQNLQAQIDATRNVVEQAIPQQVQLAAAAGAEGERVSWIAAIFALVVSGLVTLLIVRAINEPLRQLAKGTQLIARGHFWHRLPDLGSDEFAQVSRDFNAMTERLGQLDMMKKDFVSHVSHELKAPLASMRQVIHLLLQEVPGTLNNQQKNLLRLSSKSAERLTAMVGNLLDVSRMEAGTMEYAINRHDIVAIVKGVAEEFEVQADEKRIRLTVASSHPEIYIECDRDRMMQVIGNLFENALKFSPPGSEIIARVDHVDQIPHRFPTTARASAENGFVTVSVADSGPGVPDFHKTRIFEKFHQVKQGGKIAGQGVGLGLAICKTIMDAHGGAIWVEDNPSGGGLFCFSVHAAASAEVPKCVTSV
jgi:two-component system sensor histidine kinase GlrK